MTACTLPYNYYKDIFYRFFLNSETKVSSIFSSYYDAKSSGSLEYIEEIFLCY